MHYFTEYRFFLTASLLLSTPIFKWLAAFFRRTPVLKHVYAFFMPFFYLAVFLVSIAELVLGTHNPFIYFNF